MLLRVPLLGEQHVAWHYPKAPYCDVVYREGKWVMSLQMPFQSRLSRLETHLLAYSHRRAERLA